MTGAAQWLAETRFIASSMETGRIGYIEAWGGDEFGYSYTYALSGQPEEAVTVDAETGMLVLIRALAPGTYPFFAVVTNRAATLKVARFPVVLIVREGVTARRSGSQILHKTYMVDDPQFGLPAGSDYTVVLMNIRQRIMMDQVAAGDDGFRATIRFRRGRLYQYSNNRWPWSAQYVDVEAEPCMRPDSARPRLQCTGRTNWNDIEAAVIRVGRGWGYYGIATSEASLEAPKKYAYEIHTTARGSNQIRLEDATDGANLKPGRYHMVISYDQQMYGFPPNNRYFEYVKVVSVSGDVVTLDRPLRHTHREDCLEVGDPNSLGRARIVVLDRGGLGGINPRDHRWLIRSIWRDIEFVANPAGASEAQGRMVLQEGGADIELVNCVIPHLVPSNVRNARLSNCQVSDAEGDKQVGMFLADQSTIGVVTECTSFDLFFMRNSRSTALSIMPRQFRALRCTMDATNENYIGSPLYIRGPWATRSIEILATTMERSDKPTLAIVAGTPVPKVTLGLTAMWSGDRLVVPVDLRSDLFKCWVGTAWEGAIVFQGANPGFTCYGLIRKIYAPAENSALYMDIEWLSGEKPTVGDLAMDYIHELTVDSASRLSGKAFLPDTRAMMQSLPDWAAAGTRAFPASYPAAEYGF